MFFVTSSCMHVEKKICHISKLTTKFIQFQIIRNAEQFLKICNVVSIISWPN